jgi:hypothetical protein
MTFNINSFKTSGLTLGGARPSLFEIYLTLPKGVGAVSGSEEKFRFTCRAAQLPAATISSIDVGYFGRKIKVAGDRTFADWTVTVMNDEDFLVRAMFEKWSNSINRLESNVRDTVYQGNENSYKGAASVIQYGKTGDNIRSYDVVGMFPTSVDAIALDWDSQNQIETFAVTFAYDYWLPLVEGQNSYGQQAVSPVSF